MLNKKLLKLLMVVLSIGLLCTGTGVWAAKDDDKDVEDQKERAQRAADVLTEIVGVPENMPKELMQRAHAIAVIPHVVKGAFIFGGSYGKGLVSQRAEDGSWSPPSYINLGGASVGFQIGGQATDYVLIFTDENGVKPLLKGKVKLGGELSVAAGPAGRTAGAGTDLTLDSAVYTYSRSKGAFAGVSLDGAVLNIDDSANKKVYGKKVTGEEIILHRQVQPNPIVQPFLDALEKHSPPHKHGAKRTSG